MFGAKYEHGFSYSFDNDSDKKWYEKGYTQCGHCGAQFPLPKWDKGPTSTGKYRGFHMKCRSFICGPDCLGVCAGGQMAMLEIFEGKRNATAVMVTVPNRTSVIPRLVIPGIPQLD